MKNGKTLRSIAGLTIIEVLISTVVFVIGFSILVSMLNSTLGRLSAREVELSTALADEFMLRTYANADSSTLDTLVSRSGYSFRVQRSVTMDDRLIRVTLRVLRPRTKTELICLYDEMASSEQ